MAKKPAGGGAKPADKPITKAAALRDSLKVNGWNASLDKHQEYLREQHNITMSRQQISQYKSAERRRQGKRGRRRRTSEEVAAERALVGPTGRSDEILKFISAVRQWEEKLGSKKVLAAIDALYKKG